MAGRLMTRGLTSIASADIRALRPALESKLNELLRIAHNRDDLQIEPLADPLDQVIASTDREMAVRKLDHQVRLIRDLEFALARIKSGDYGRCEICAEPISRKRLNAIPWATRCVVCQSREEATHGDLLLQQAA